MKIIRFVVNARGESEVVVCTDTARSNRGEVYFFSGEDVYGVMPCIYFRVRQNSRTLRDEEWEHWVDGYGYALHLENETFRQAGGSVARIYSADRTIIASALAGIESARLSELMQAQLRIVVEEEATLLSLPSVSFVAQSMRSIRSWLTLNAGDWVMFPLAAEARTVRFPVRVYLYESERLVLDELLRR